MVLKRIISCLAIISVVFLMSCYDVAYDKDEGVSTSSSSGNWTEGLTTKQIVEGMEIKANISNDSTTSKCTDCEEEVFELVWVLPVFIGGNWSVYSLALGEDTDDDWELLLDTVTSEKISDGYWKYTCKTKRTWVPNEYLISYKVCLTDANNKTFTNIVSFSVLPNDATLRITIDPASERNTAKTTLAGFWLTKEWKLYCNIESYWTPVPIESNAITNANAKSYVPVYFRIKSDLTAQGLGIVTHYSNSSFCKTSKITPNAIDALATFQFKFEDLPLEQLRNEPDGAYDYDDVIFKVEVLK